MLLLLLSLFLVYIFILMMMFENIEKKDGEMKNKIKKKTFGLYLFLYVASEIIFILFFSLI